MNLLNLEPKKAVYDITNYSNCIYGIPKIGKTTFVHDLYGSEVLFLATEDRHETLVGAYVQRIRCWSDYLMAIAQLQNPALKERFKVVCIDTTSNLYEMLEAFVADKYDEAKLGERKDIWGADYVEVKKTWPKALAMIADAGYKPCFVFHAVQQKVKVPLCDFDLSDPTNQGIGQVVTVKEEVEGSKTKVDVQYIEYEKYVPDVPDKIFGPVNKMVDNILFLHEGLDSNGNAGRMIQTRETLQWQAGSTFKDMQPTLPLSANAYKEAVENCIKSLDPNFVVSHKEEEVREELDFNTLMAQAKDLGFKLHSAGKGAILTRIVDRIFGTGNKLTEAKIGQEELLRATIIELEQEVAKL